METFEEKADAVPRVEQEQVKRNKGPSRLYHIFGIIAFAIAAFIGVVSIGLFGVKHSQVSGFAKDNAIFDTDQVCILFAQSNGNNIITLSKDSSCVFVLWGQASVIFLFIGWLVYSLVLTIVGPKIISLFRIPDLLFAILGVLISSAVSICISAGLNTTCGAFQSQSSCQQARLRGPLTDNEIRFYENVNAAQVTSWILTLINVILLLWNGTLCIAYCIRAKRARSSYAVHEKFENEPE